MPSSYRPLLQETTATAAAERERLMPYHVEGSIRAFSGSYREGVFHDLDTRYYGLADLPEIVARAIRLNPDRFCPS